MPPDDKETSTMVRSDGTYASLPLKKDTISITIAQTRVNGVDGKNPAKDIKNNLDYMLECIDIARATVAEVISFASMNFPLLASAIGQGKIIIELQLKCRDRKLKKLGKSAKIMGVTSSLEPMPRIQIGPITSCI